MLMDSFGCVAREGMECKRQRVQAHLQVRARFASPYDIHTNVPADLLQGRNALGVDVDRDLTIPLNPARFRL